MFPLFFDYQALGDDFFIDLAETQFQYFIPSVNGKNNCRFEFEKKINNRFCRTSVMWFM